MRRRSKRLAGGPGVIVTSALLPAQAVHLKRHADARGVSISAMVRHAVREFLRVAADR